jgi:hypothetical protein
MGKPFYGKRSELFFLLFFLLFSNGAYSIVHIFSIFVQIFMPFLSKLSRSLQQTTLSIFSIKKTANCRGTPAQIFQKFKHLVSHNFVAGNLQACKMAQLQGALCSNFSKLL